MFVQALVKLGKFEGFKEQRVAYNVAKVIRRFDAESTIAQELFLKLVKQYAVLDEKGNIKSPEDKPGTYEIPDEKVADWKKAKEDFDDVEFELDCHKIRLEQLGNAPLSPIDLNALEPLLSELEAVAAPEEKSA
jgi:hypothetical protein